MNEKSIVRTATRHPLLAGTLSLLTPGLGQVYCGRIKRGLVFITIAITAMPICFLLLTRLWPSTTTALFAALGGYALTTLIPLLDAVWVARRTRPDYQRKEYNHWLIYLLLWSVSAGGSLGFVLHARDNRIEAFRVPAASMYPTILPNDRILANKAAYRTSDPQRGDLVIFTPMHQRQAKWIKRVIALAGDTVEIREDQVFVNDVALGRKALPNGSLPLMTHYPAGPLKGQRIQGKVYEESNGRMTYLVLHRGKTRPGDIDAANVPKTTIPKDHCYVLGDFRDNSRDSRYVGPIPLVTLVGRADYLYWPAGDWSRFGPISGLHQRVPDK